MKPSGVTSFPSMSTCYLDEEANHVCITALYRMHERTLATFDILSRRTCTTWGQFWSHSDSKCKTSHVMVWKLLSVQQKDWPSHWYQHLHPAAFWPSVCVHVVQPDEGGSTLQMVRRKMRQIANIEQRSKLWGCRETEEKESTLLDFPLILSEHELWEQLKHQYFHFNDLRTL